MARSASAAHAREALVALDRELARLSRGGARVRLRIGEALELLRRRGWHHELGFSRLGGYALERCGQKGRWAAESCALARRLAELPVLRAALVRGEIGWSMAELVARKATASTESELVAAAKGATVRQMRARLSEAGESGDVEAAVAGRVALRFWVSEDTRSLWRGFLECFRAVRGFLPPRVTPLEFLCGTFHVVWGRALEAEGKRRPIHDRDGWMCKSPVCENRLGLNAHHLLPVGQGGGDEPENLASLCGGCHIHGVHEGRLMAFPPASNIQWVVGRQPIMVVQGRRKLTTA